MEIVVAQTPNIIKMEYFIDADPGRGGGVDIPLTPATNLNFSFNVPTGSLTEGFHVLTIRAQDENFVWGQPENKVFFVGQSNTLSQNNITKIEYFIDTDPGRGSGVDVPITAATNLDFLENIPTATLSGGFHILTVRAQDQNGIWGLSENKIFFVSESNTLAQNDITKIEYFMDSDPGIGLGVDVPLTAAPNLNFTENIPTGALSEGFHVLSVRAQDQNGKWSLFENKVFFVSQSSTLSQNDIIKIEYYVDTDPGIGAGVDVPLTAAPNLNFLENIPTSTLSEGMHTLNIRAQDQNGEWSLSERKPFFVDQTRQIINYEYAIDVDPGIAMATQVPIAPPQLSIDEILNIDTTPLSIGAHNVYIRIEDNNFFWSKTSIVPFNVCTGANASFSTNVVCQGTTTLFSDLSINVMPGDTYSWDLDGDLIEDDNTIGSISFIYPTAGSFSATLTIDRSGCTSVFPFNVDVDAPAIASAGANLSICEGNPANLSGSIGGSASTVTWSGGAGSFDNVNSLTPIYTHDISEIGAGPITITMTTDDPPGTCPATSSNVNATINQQPIANAGSSVTICASDPITLNGIIGGSASSSTWSTSGDGMFDNNSLLNATYTPGSTDISNTTVSLTLTTDDPDGVGGCLAGSSFITVTIDPAPTVDAGVDITTCEGNTVNFTGTIGGSASTVLWSGGAGSFDDDTSLTPIYTPDISEVGIGPIVITLTTDDPVGTCLAATSTVNLTVAPLPTANAGANFSICSGDDATLAGSIGGAASSSTWATSGDGSFDNVSLLNAIYTPGIADLLSGTVDLTLTTDDPDGVGPCTAASNLITLTIDRAPNAGAGLDATICANDVVILTGTLNAFASNPVWSTSGTGTFSSNNTINSSYTPSAADIAMGSIDITLTADGSGVCPQISDQLTVTIAAPILAGTPVILANIGQASNIDVIGASTINTGDVIVVSIITNPTKGSATVLGNNTIDYTASTGTVGADSFQYRICNQCSLCSDGTVSIDVLNASPVITIPPTPFTVAVGQTVTIPFGSFLSDLNDNIDFTSIQIISGPSSSANATFDGSFNLTLDYSNTTFEGTDQVIIEVCDLLGACSQVTIQIEVDGSITVYTGISPNGDGMNDYFKINNIQFVEPQNHIFIYNRWGDIVFDIQNYDSSNPDKRFNGVSNNGKELSSGVYFYKVEFKSVSESLSGYLTIVR